MECLLWGYCAFSGMREVAAVAGEVAVGRVGQGSDDSGRYAEVLSHARYPHNEHMGCSFCSSCAWVECVCTRNKDTCTKPMK
jgi:hypothetical protein